MDALADTLDPAQFDGYAPVLVHRGEGFNVYENYEAIPSDNWWTVQIELGSSPACLRKSLDWFADNTEVFDGDADEQHLWFDVRPRA